MMDVEDFLGNKVVIGSRVCVAITDYRTPTLRVGRVVAFYEPDPDSYDWNAKDGKLGIEWEAGSGYTIPPKPTRIFVRLKRFVVVA